MIHWQYAAPLCTVLVVAVPTPVMAKEREVLVLLDVGEDIPPGRVCVHSSMVGPPLADQQAPVPVPPSCVQANRGACESCQPPPPNTYATCRVGDTDGPELHLSLEHAGLNRFDIEGKMLRLLIDESESPTYPARMAVLGGGYHSSELTGLRATDSVELPLVPRCIKRRLEFASTPDSSCAEPRLLTNQAELTVSSELNLESNVLLSVRKGGRDNTITLDLCGTIYEGSYDYPEAGDVALMPTAFPLEWSGSCFVPDQCPTATLTRYQTECVACGGEVNFEEHPACQVPEGFKGCRYSCRPQLPVEFPTPVKFSLSRTRTKGDRAEWEQEAQFPGDRLTGYTESADRRVLLVWPEGDPWDRSGAEIDAVLVTSPDGRTQRLQRAGQAKGATWIRVPGLQCDERFVYQYEGRWPYSVGSVELEGDTLKLPPSSEKRQNLRLGLRVHGGALGTGFQVPRRAAWSPFVDVEIPAFILGPKGYPGWEIALSGALSLHPSAARYGDEDTDWTEDPLVRVLIGPGYAFYASDHVAITPGFSAGFAFPAIARSWKDSTEYPVFGLRTRVSYEITRATSLELGGWCFFPEQYIETVQDEAGPRSTRSRLGASVGISGGLQWTDVL